MKKLFIYKIYGNAEGVCTEDFKQKVIEFWADSEFDNDIEEAETQVEFEEVEINKLD